MPYGTDVTVFVEDNQGDLGAPPQPGAAWWLSPDVDIPAHSGAAVQGTNQVQIRVHAADEPILDEKIVAEVYVGNPSLVMSPTTGTQRIDPGNLLFRPAGVSGSEPVATNAGGTLSFAWVPSASPANVDGPGHRCLVVRAFPQSVTPPTSAFDVPNERHEAQHNIEILTTSTASGAMADGAAGTRADPRRRDEATGMWWEKLDTLAASRRGRRFVVWAVDPSPSKRVVAGLREALAQAEISGFSKEPPGKVTLEAVGTDGEEIDPRRLLEDSRFAKRAGLGRGLFAENRLLGAAALDLGPREGSGLVLRFDHSNLAPRTAVVLHGAQWSQTGRPEGGMTVVALAPIDA
jgi:hypothetical protein